MSVVTPTIQNQVSELYITFFGRAPDAIGFGHWAQSLANGATVSQIAQAFSQTPEFESQYGGLTPEQQVARFYENVLNRAPDADGLAFWTAKVTGGMAFYDVAYAIVNTAFTGGPGVGADDNALVMNKVTIAQYFALELASNDFAVAQTAFVGVTADPASVTAKEAELDAAVNAGTTYTLTTGVDTATATTFNGLVNGVAAANNTFTPLDTLTGQQTTATANSLRLIDLGDGDLVTADITPAGASLANIGSLEIVAADDVGTLSTAGTLFSGVTNVTLLNAGKVDSYTASASQNVSATNTAQGANNLVYQGGVNLTIANTGTGTTGTTTIGSTTAPTGAVALTVTNNSTVDAATGVIEITGGSTVEVTSVAANAVNTTLTQGNVTVTGTANTTAVTVNQAAAVTKSATVAGVVAGDVNVLDANRASATAAGTIANVTLENFGAATVDSGALSTLNLSGTATSATVKLGSLSTPSVTTFNLNVDGLIATGAVTVPTVTTLNIDSSGADSSIGDLKAVAAKSVTVSGDAALTVSANTLTALTDITVTNTAGFSLAGTDINTGASFTGGTGDDAVVIGATTKSISMGDGDDTVTTSTGTVGTGGTVDAGDGFDTVSMSGANAATVSGTSVFNSKFTNFEQLEVTTPASSTINLVGINGVNSVVTGGATLLTLNGYSTNGTLRLNANGTAYVANVTNAAFNPSDVFNIDLDKDGVLAAGSVTVADVETIAISAPDALAAGSAAAINTLTLVATSATAVTVSGNNGLTLTNTTNTAITSFDASGVVANGSADTPANLKVTFTSANATTTATVSITGGAGDDALTGNAAKDVIFGREGNDLLVGANGADTIDGGADNDTIDGGAGADVLTGGAGDDTFVYAAVSDSAASVSANTTVTFDTITDFTSGDDSMDIALINTTLTGGAAATGITISVLTTAAGSLGNTTINTFADLSAAAAGLLTASAAGAAGAATGIQAYVIDLTGNTGALGTGTYLVVNNSDTNLTALDVMVAWTGTSEAPVASDFVL